MLDTVTVNASKGSYEVTIGRGLSIGNLLKTVKHECHVCVISDDTVFSLYGKKTMDSLEAVGYTVDSFVFPHGETSKNMHTVVDILEFLAEKELTRSDILLALGGGVVGDITGFAASIYLRGIDFVQVPTTLLAAVDSSVGGKTGADLKAGKNLVGAFHQPIAVFLDVDSFNSLPKEQFAEGMAESIKYGMILDKDLFETFEKGDYEIEDICKRCIELKAMIVKEDEFDTGLRQILNFGHTPAHAIEKLSNFTVSHGFAVGIGMAIMTKVSERKGLLEKGSYERLEKVLLKNGLLTKTEYSSKELAMNTLTDKKRKGNDISLILLEQIGKAKIIKVPVTEIEAYYKLGY